MVDKTQAWRVLEYTRNHGIVRPRDMERMGLPRVVIRRLVGQRRLTRRSRGIYTLPDHEPTPHTGLAEVCARVPKAVVCLLSALEFHGLTTQIPHEVWVMVDRAGRRPRITHPVIRVVYASGAALHAGTIEHKIEGVAVRITSPAKTVADCFKYRRHVGQEVAVEALRDCLRQRKATPSEIHGFGKIDRVARLMRPYLEAIG